MDAYKFLMLRRVSLSVGVVGVGVSACGTTSSTSVTDAAVEADASLSAMDAMVDAATNVDAPESGSCVSPDDCLALLPGPAVACCIDETCIYGQAAIDAIPCTDADVQLISASRYDQSCQLDTDCIAVAEGNFCIAGANNCASAAINKGAYSQYQADVAKTNAAICGAFTNCPAEFAPCCRQGQCQTGRNCSD